MGGGGGGAVVVAHNLWSPTDKYNRIWIMLSLIFTTKRKKSEGSSHEVKKEEQETVNFSHQHKLFSNMGVFKTLFSVSPLAHFHH